MSDLASNRKAFRDYEVLETYEAGIVLLGTEIKSLRNHGGNIKESYVKIISNELWLLGAHIAQYRFGNIHNHDEIRDRKLLMHKREIQKLQVAIKEKGLTIVPLALYLKKGTVKIKIGKCKGKKTIDKRASIRERDEKRHLQRTLKSAEC